MKQTIMIIALLAVIAVNGLANALPLNGQTTGEISNRLNVLFTPAGYVFSIWGFIYILLIIWVIRSVKKWSVIYERAYVPFLASCAFNITWIFMWHYEFFAVSVAVITGLLLSLIVLYQRIEKEAFSFWDRLPFSVYLGWVSVAVIANVSYTLTHYQWNGFGLSDTVWTVGLIIIAAALAVSFRFFHQDRAYPLVFVWALIGIAVRNWGDAQTVVYASLAAAAVIFISAIWKK